MSDGYSSRIWQCPYFKWDERSKVYGECGKITLPREEFSKYVEQYCASVQGWRSCQLAEALTRHYERTE